MSEESKRRGKRLMDEPLYLGLNATTKSLTKITGLEWYQSYGKETESDRCEGRLVTMYKFSENWDSWEMHPHEEEAVICVHGSVTLVQEVDGMETTMLLNAGEYCVNPRIQCQPQRRLAHSAEPCTVIFITPGQGTQLKPRMVQLVSDPTIVTQRKSIREGSIMPSRCFRDE